MKILLPVIGVRGDVQIFLALAKALIGKGHITTVALPNKFLPLSESYGIDSYSLGGNEDAGVKEMQEIMRAKTTLDAAKLGMSFFFRGVREQTDTLQKLIPEYDIVTGYGNFGKAEADKSGKPFFSIVIDPAMAEKRYTVNIVKNIGLFIEKLPHYFLMNKEYSKFSREIAAPPSAQLKNPRLILLPMSQHVVKRESNWTTKNIISGYWYLNTPSEYTPPSDLQAFIQQGEKPIFISFGSAGWSEDNSIDILNLLYETINNLKVRAIILTSDTPNTSNKPDGAFLVKEVPYSWMLSKVSCVVHHCGMGTTAEILKAGIPSVPVPYMIDQFAWAKRIHSLGVATAPISRKQLTQEKLENAIKQALDSPNLKSNAEKLGNSIRTETGLENAVAAIEKLA